MYEAYKNTINEAEVVQNEEKKEEDELEFVLNSNRAAAAFPVL